MTDDPLAARYFLERLNPRCARCQAKEARVRLCVDPGPEQPVTVLGAYCRPCATVALKDAGRGRHVFVGQDDHD